MWRKESDGTYCWHIYQFHEISLSPVWQNVTSTKPNPFGPAISERSLRRLKETAGHEPTCLIATVVSAWPFGLPQQSDHKIICDIVWQNAKRLRYTQTPCRPCKLNAFPYINTIHRVSQIFLCFWIEIRRHEPDIYFRNTDSSLRPLSNNNYRGRIP